jgi:hypothetical protein
MSRSANHYFTGVGRSGPANYIEDVFSTFLYTGDSAVFGTERVSGVPMSGVTLNPGMIWVKNRSSASNHYIYSSPPGASIYRSTNTTAGNLSSATGIYNFSQIEASSNGFYTYGDDIKTNQSGQNYVSWTFKEQPKFFDVVTYTGNGSTQTISHNLGSVPGCIMVKKTSGSSTYGWFVYHRGLSANQNLLLNTTDAVGYVNGLCATTPTSTTFSVDSTADINASGGTYVAYLFAHDAGGFGQTGNDNVISCGSYTGNGSTTGPVVTLGYEPQWIMVKNASATTDWVILDTMRGLVVGGTDRELNPNQSGAESGAVYITPTATGFQLNTTNGAYNASGNTFIYVAIRRGPMKVPTVGTSVFTTLVRTGTGSTTTATGFGFTPDLLIVKAKDGREGQWFDRLRGRLTNLRIPGAYVEQVETNSLTGFDLMDGVSFGADQNAQTNPSGVSLINHIFKRAPGFMDVVCYTGDGNLSTSGTVYNVSHNLTVEPEMVIIRSRSVSGVWYPAVTISSTQWVNGPTTALGLDRTDPADTPINFSTLSYRTTTTFRPAVVAGNSGGGYSGTTNDAGVTYVAYLFATCPGVSKVGSYTGTGTTLQINCGFTGGARFVLIKRTDSTGAWFVWDTARGIISGNDPYILINATAAEVTNTDYIDSYSPGFELSSTAPAAINANGGTYIFLAIA